VEFASIINHQLGNKKLVPHMQKQKDDYTARKWMRQKLFLYKRERESQEVAIVDMRVASAHLWPSSSFIIIYRSGECRGVSTQQQQALRNTHIQGPSSSVSIGGATGGVRPASIEGTTTIAAREAEE
jgi:hypothetical protein